MNGSSMCLSSAPTDCAEPDAEPVVVRRPEREQLRAERGRVLGDHVGVHHEAAGGEHHRAARGPPRSRRSAARPRRRPRRRRRRPGGSRRSRSAPRRRPPRPASRSRSITILVPSVSPGTGTLWPRGAGRAWSTERPDLLVAGEHQPLGAGLDHRLLRVEGALELEARAPRASRSARPSPRSRRGSCPCSGSLETGRSRYVAHLLGGVLVPGRLLHGGAAAEVEVAAGHARRAAVHGGPLQQQHPRPGPRRLEGGAAAGDAEADDHHVVRLGVRRGRRWRGSTVRAAAVQLVSVMAPRLEHVSVWGEAPMDR